MAADLFCVRGLGVLITGGAGGIGATLARAFAARGCRVAVADVGAGRAAKAAEEMSGDVRGYALDVCDAKAADGAVAAIAADLGGLDVLINCAGVTVRKPAVDLTIEEYDRIANVNTRGAWVVSTACARLMQQRGGGSIINIDSLVTHAPLRHVVAYAVSKGGLASMTRGLAVELGPAGIRVNAVAPGFVLTDISSALWSRPAMKEWARDVTPLQRMPAPEDMTGAVLFLASPAASMITGQTLRVDGGVSAGMHWPIEQAARL
eukprot:TRINITY_DN36227_c0_g1_i1.p2 TRINITY_DN36227_c0_g1~~TRINITY_DN36227_c0_g1_i1.p2  ORF type:complete len:281 (+),score=100.79 TRINITY_DN36227_c0_g1_i1:56-844(+)